MRQIILSISLIFCVLSISPIQCMWYAVDPKDTSQLITSVDSNYVLKKFMMAASLHASQLDADQENGRVEEYCCQHQRKQKKSSLLTVVCPDPECGVKLSPSKGGENVLQVKLFSHWFTTKTHQEAFHKQANEFLAESRSEAKRKFAQRKPFTVIPFPGNNNLAEGQEIENAQQAAAVRAPQLKLVRVPAQQLKYYLLEALPGNHHIIATFIANSREKVLEAYLISKMLQGQLDGIEPLKTELLTRTKKQRMVQGDVVRNLVCPAQGCEYQVTEAVQNALEKLTQTLLVHYAAYHNQESPGIKKLVDLIAPSFDEARKKIEEGEKHA